MPRTSDERRSADLALLRAAEVLGQDRHGGELLVPTREMMEQLVLRYQEAATFARSAAEVSFYAQTVAVLRRLDSRITSLENMPSPR